MAESGNPNPKAGKLSRVGRRTARRRRNFPESREPEVEEEDRGEKQSFGEKFVMEKVQEFFLECGGGERGFITREDMQKLQQKFPFSSEELEMVFDNLDVDTKGILTPEQLTEGLSQFLSDQGEDRNVSCLKVAAEPQYTHSDSHSLQDQVDVEDEEKHQFAALMEKLGAAVIFEDKSEIWKLWIQLRRNEPNLLGHLEDFLSKMTGQIQDTLHEKEDLERTLKKKMVEHNADMQRLYEEMELQINNEKERIEEEIVVRFQAQSQDLQKELDSKQDEVQHLVQMQAQLQAELVSLRCKQDETSAGNQELKMSSQEMAWQVEGVQQELQEARDRLVILQEEAAHWEEREGEWRQSLGLEGPRSEEAVQQLQAELESLRSKRDETSTENQELHLTNQELEARLEGIQQELQVAQDRLEILQEEAAHGEEREGELDPSPGQCSKEAFQQLQAELVSLHSKQDETSTENQELHLTNQELGARLEGIEQELQEARDRLVTFQEEAAHRVERGGELDPTPGSAGPCSEEAFQQLQAELVSLHSKQDETSTENQQLHLTNQELGARLEEARDRLVILQEEAAHREERGGELDPSSGSVGSGSEETIQKLQAELESLHSKQDETSTENQELHLTNQELGARLEGIEQELQEARDRLVILQEEAAHREEGEGELDRTPGIEGWCSEEAIQQLQAELVSLRSKQDETSTENQQLELTNQEMKTQLEGIQQELQEARDQLVILQEEKEKGEDQQSGIGRADSDEVALQLQAELVSLRSKQDETSTENQQLELTNQEMKTQLEGIQQELQEARDQLVILQEEKEKGEDQQSGIGRADSDEVALQLQAELESLRSKQDETSTENQELHLTNQELEARLEGIQQELEEARDRLVIPQEDAARQEEGDGELDWTPSIEGWCSEEATQQLQAELVSLRSKQDETSTENQQLELTNQEMKTQLEGIQQELQEARDQLVILQEEKEKGDDQQSGIGRADSDEVALQLQAELVSLRSKQDETSTENQQLELTNQEMKTQLEGIQQELQEARDQLVILQEEKEKGEDQQSGIGRADSDEVALQLQAELESLRSKQDETSTENQELHLTNQELEARLEGIQQELQEARDRLVIPQEDAARQEEGDGLKRTGSIRRRGAPNMSTAKPDALRDDPHLRVEGHEVTLGTGRDADHEETAAASGGEGAAERIKELQAELVSLRNKQDETSTENQQLHLTNQELEARLEGIQQELQEGRDRLVILQEARDGALDRAAGSGGQLSEEGVLQLQAELESLRNKQGETSTENQELHLTNQELEARLVGIQQELQEAGDRLVILHEEAAHREEREGALEQPPGSEGELCHEDILQLQAELESLHSKQDETSTENQQLHLTNQELEARLEGIQQELQEARDRLVILQEEAAHRDEGEGLQRTRSIRRRVARDTSGKPDAPGEDPHLRVEGQEVTLRTDGDRDREETAAASAGDGATETTKELQVELVSLRSKLDETSTENQEIKLANQELKAQLEGIQQELQEARDRLVILQEEAAHREEREGLQRTCSIRRRGPRDPSNKPGTLGDEGQEVALGEGGDGAHEETAAVSSSDSTAETVKELQAELESLRSKQDETSTENQAFTLINQELEARLVGIQQELQEARDQLVILQEEAAHRDKGEGLQRTYTIRRRVTRDTSRKPGTPGDDPRLKVEGQGVTLGTGDDGDDEETAAASAGDRAEERTNKMAGSKDPDQVYNIMFVGNSNSGKTSFIQHFCDGNTQPGLPSTVGIDYRVKTLMVEGRHVALQLWDTAGQERFHCVTKQYFRKADGVIVMYDIASSSSFSTVRYWLSCVKEAASDDVCILLLGNKLDDTAHRQVSKAEAELLAQEYNILFYECSAFTGQNIVACIVHLTKTLKQQEERIQGKTVELVKKPAEKKKCCS